MKYLITITLLLFVNLSMAQVAASYYMTNKGKVEYKKHKEFNLIDKVLVNQFGFENQTGLYEMTHGSWTYQFDIKVKKDLIIYDFYAFPNVDYYDKHKQLVILNAFHDLVVYAVTNKEVQPTLPYELVGWDK